MLSLYFHIPFCSQICSYCSFSVIEKASDEMIRSYLIQLHQEIDHYGKLYPKAEIKSIYFGGGTPNLIGAEHLKKLIDHCEQVFSCETVAELSFECNPYPQEEMLAFVRSLNRQYERRPRVRFSFGLQSFDNAVLSQAGRPCSFLGLVDFLRSLQPLKQENNVFNFDFIAFGTFHQTKKGEKQLWTQPAFSFFEDFVHSHFADSFSLYTLEHSEHQRRSREKKADLISRGCFGTEDEIYEEFDLLKSVLFEAGYARYEISNFSLIAKSSIHNRVYRELEAYVGLGLGASSFVDEKRYTNTPYLPKYLTGQTVETSSVQTLTKQDYLIEKFFLGLRTDRGIQEVSAFSSVLVDNWKEKMKLYENEGFIHLHDKGLVLTDKGMDCYNWIITELLKEV
ncbi:MAG: radical SAM protein [Candidatus Peribacteria bacterium]|nr:radical SAM protein [Candidatus Peribacteria bacterium]